MEKLTFLHFKGGNYYEGFFKDYFKICKDYGKFCKRHWKGVIILNIVCIVVMFIPYVIQENVIQEKMLSKWYEERVKEMNNEKEEES